MGYGKYSLDDRTVRATTMGYSTKSRDDIFIQNKKRMIHEQMNPKGVALRESCDSEKHPNTTTIQLYLDDTGSMGNIPHELIKEGLPTLIGSLIQNGVEDVALMFGAVGDHECDSYPLQVGQFESGDAEMDMWLERTYLEGGGGGNEGESYLLAWYFAANHVRTDAFDKRGKKGFVFTIGDEPCLRTLPASAVKAIMGDSSAAQGSLTREKLLEEVQKKNNVYHIHINHGHGMDVAWKNMLGQHAIEIYDYTLVGKTISDIILSHKEEIVSTVKPDDSEESTPKRKKIML